MDHISSPIYNYLTSSIMEEYRLFKNRNRIQWRPLMERLRGTPARLKDRVSSVNPYLFSIALPERFTLLELVGDLIIKETWWRNELNKIINNEEHCFKLSLTQDNYNAKSMVVLLRDFETRRMVIYTQLRQFYDLFNETESEDCLGRVFDLALTIAENDDMILSGIGGLTKELNSSSMRVFKGC